MNKTKVINIVGGPGAGKSTIASGVFNLLKMNQMNAELVNEYPKSLIWEERKKTFDDSLYLFAKQAHIQYSINGKVDYMVTDRPLIMSNMYHNFWMEKDWTPEWNKSFYDLVKATWDMYDNRVYFIERSFPYVAQGRNENAQEALAQDKLTRKWLDDYGIDYIVVKGDKEAHFRIFEDIIITDKGKDISIL